MAQTDALVLPSCHKPFQLAAYVKQFNLPLNTMGFALEQLACTRIKYYWTNDFG
jgi:hypothetical protein